jgi:transcriptional activator SPT7
LQAIDARRDCVRLSDHELRDLLIEVRSGKDDRIEFTEAMVRLLEELKSSEHASAFLTKVAKRDAPDYYDVIKNPMDIGTMLRNVRQGRYKSKAQFMRDLDLIWDNCLTYNSEPTHPLRRSVQVLRAKANHLLTYVNDTNDVKEALNHWQASLGLQRRPSDASMAGTNVRIEGMGDQSTLSKTGIGLSRISVTSLIDTPFEQRPALLRNAEAMKTFEMLNSSLNDLDLEFDHQYLNPVAGPSSRTLDLPSHQSAVVQRSLDMLKTLEGAQKGVLRKALTTLPEEDSPSGPSAKQHTGENSAVQDDESSPMPYPLEPEEVERETGQEAYDIGAVWWNSMAHPSLLASGVSTLHSSEQLPNKRIGYVGGRPAKKRRQNGVIEDQNTDTNRLTGASKAVEKNVRVITRLRRTHMKYGRLNNHIEVSD